MVKGPLRWLNFNNSFTRFQIQGDFECEKNFDKVITAPVEAFKNNMDNLNQSVTQLKIANSKLISQQENALV